MKTFWDETIEIAAQKGPEIQAKFLEEVKRILSTGALDPKDHNRGFIFGMALENLSDNYLSGLRGSRGYKNLKGR